jgi:PAS domain-containing protein
MREGIKMGVVLDKVMNGTDDRLALLQVLADNSFDSVLITDASAEGKIIYANQSFERLTGYDPSSVVGGPRAFFKALPQTKGLLPAFPMH